jgi:hypothetical protein
VFDWLNQVQSSPLTYRVILAAGALDTVLPIVPSEAVVIAASVLPRRKVVDLADCPGRRGWRFLNDSGSNLLGCTAGGN